MEWNEGKWRNTIESSSYTAVPTGNGDIDLSNDMASLSRALTDPVLYSLPRRKWSGKYHSTFHE